MTVPGQLLLTGFPTPREQRGLDVTPPGAERLLAELVVRGLPADRLEAAAALVLELEAEAEGEAPAP
jgi:hypothetical protein